MIGAPPESRGRPPGRRGELIAAAGAIVLLISMLGLQWYGVTGVRSPYGPLSAVAGAQSAWRALTILRWLMLLTVVVALGSAVLRGRRPQHGSRIDLSLPVTVLGSATALLLAYRVLIDLPSPSTIVDQKLGAFLGLLSAVAIALGGYGSRRDVGDAGPPRDSRPRA